MTTSEIQNTVVTSASKAGPVSGGPEEFAAPRKQYDEKNVQSKKLYEDALEKESAALKKKGELTSYLEVEKELRLPPESLMTVHRTGVPVKWAFGQLKTDTILTGESLTALRKERSTRLTTYKPESKSLFNAKLRYKKETDAARKAYRKKLDELVKDFVRAERIADAVFIQEEIDNLDFLYPEPPPQGRRGR